jgi:DNA-binding transcriptional LysR family regulator
MTLRQLASLRALERTGSLSAAGRELGLSQSAVSLQMRDLAAEVGVALYRVRRNRVVLTVSGAELARYAQRMLALAEEASEAARAKARHGGLVRVAASSTPGVNILPGLLARYRRSHPAVLVTLTVTNTEDVEHRIRRGDVDVGVVGGRLGSGDLRVEPWWEDEIVLVVPGSHPLADRRSVPVTALANDLVLAREHGSATRTTYEAAMLSHGLPLPATHVVGDTEAIKRSVAAGLGIGLLSRFSVGDELKSGNLAALRLVGLPLRRPLHLLLPSDRDVSEPVSEFIGFLRNTREPRAPQTRRATAR